MGGQARPGLSAAPVSSSSCEKHPVDCATDCKGTVCSHSVFSKVFDTARFRLCPKQLNQGHPRFRTAALMLAPLSVVRQETLSKLNYHSRRASCRASAKLTAVWSSGKKLVWRHFDTSFQSWSIKCTVSDIYGAIVALDHKSVVRVRCSSLLTLL